MLRKRRAYFHTNLESEANKCIDSVPLAVNATGIEYFYEPFEVPNIVRLDYSFVYVIDGNMYFDLNGEKITLEKGGVIIFKPQTGSLYGTKSNNLNYIWLQFTGNRVADTLKKMNIACNTPHKVGLYEEMKNCFSKIAREFLMNDSLFADTSVALLITALAMLSRKLNSKGGYFRRSAEYIEANYNQHISIEQLADIEGLSQSHYRAGFKKVHNVTPNEYIIMKRINSACFYLSHTTYSIEQIAQTVGYTDSFYFSRVFKKKTGVSPSQYRRNFIK